MNNFADRLKALMKERKISGQKIADAISVSQKTISRYATGEIEPNEEMQRKVLSAVAEIGGHPEDAEYKPKKFIFPNTLRELITSGIDLVSEEELLACELQEMEMDKDMACRVFSLLLESNQKFVIENFETFSGLEVYEIALVESFARISKDMQDFVLEGLEMVRMNCVEMGMYASTCKKISNYMQMISKCKSITIESIEKFDDIPDGYETTDLINEYAELLEHTRGIDVENLGNYLLELITFDERDWYLLMLVQFLTLRDKGANTTYHGKIVGDRVFGLLNYLEGMVNANE